MPLPAGIFLSVILLHVCIYYGVDAKTIKCYQCEGVNCGTKKSATCEGEFCLATTFLPAVGHKLKLGEAKFIKGCVSGGTNLGYVDYVNKCLRYKDGKDLIKTCVCDTELCNKGYRSCACEGFDYCDNAKCIGELCTYVQSLSTNEVSKGCLNTTIPLLEHHLIDSCITPAFVGGLHHNVLDPSKALDYSMCVCMENQCNKKKLQSSRKSTVQNCSVQLSATFEGINIKTKTSRCSGEFCFDADISSPSLKSNARGCINYLISNDVRPEPGCVKITAPGTDSQVCFGTNSIQKDASEPEESREDEDDHEEENEEDGEELEDENKDSDSEDEEEKAGSEGENSKKQSPSGSAIAGERSKEKLKQGSKKPPQQKQPEREPKESIKESASLNQAQEYTKEAEKLVEKENVDASRKERHQQTEVEKEALEDETIGNNNTVIVVVFVIIILVIILVGLSWKFELPKKIFQARYQTVSG